MTLRLLLVAKASEMRRFAGRPSHEIYAAVEDLERHADSLREQAGRLRALADLALASELGKSVGGVK